MSDFKFPGWCTLKKGKVLGMEGRQNTLGSLGWIAGGLVAFLWLGKQLARGVGHQIIDQIGDRAVNVLTQDPYPENLLEAGVGFYRSGVISLLETDLRSGSDTPLKRPLGSIRSDLPHFDRLLFDFAQVHRLPVPHEQPVDATTVIGPRTRRPLVLETPLVISGMAYGVALSKKAKVALARGATGAGTATNTGEGPFLSEERRAARKLIVQYHRGNWMRLESLQHADMVEIHLGQGSSGGGGHRLPSAEIDGELRRAMGLGPGDAAVSRARFEGMERGEDLHRIVDQARRAAPQGVPIGVKIAAGQSLEEDLALCVDAGVDAIAIDGAQAGTHGSLPATADHFGLPTLIALRRARCFLDRCDPERTVSLIIGGGILSPADCLKSLALGADAIYLGSAVMYALVVGQHLRATPFEPPSSLIMHRGQYRERFDPNVGARRVKHLLTSMTGEMVEAVRSLGHDHLHDVSLSDLFALDRETARFCGVPCAFDTPGVNSPSRSDTGHETKGLLKAASRQPRWIRQS